MYLSTRIYWHYVVPSTYVYINHAHNKTKICHVENATWSSIDGRWPIRWPHRRTISPNSQGRRWKLSTGRGYNTRSASGGGDSYFGLLGSRGPRRPFPLGEQLMIGRPEHVLWRHLDTRPTSSSNPLRRCKPSSRSITSLCSAGLGGRKNIRHGGAPGHPTVSGFSRFSGGRLNYPLPRARQPSMFFTVGNACFSLRGRRRMSSF